MRRTIVPVALAAVLAGGAIGYAVAGDKLEAPTTIHVVERATTDKVVDVGRPGDSTGDLLTFHNLLFDETNTHRVGHDQGECLRISARQGTWECRWIAWIDGMGAITVEGQFSDHHGTVLAITGGTGQFRNARGSMRLGFRDDPAEFDFVYKLIP
ncbi:MAG TPA: allene oxide cyclase family protein [Actinomycetota bacterium]